jgi:hypothetical protein
LKRGLQNQKQTKANADLFLDTVLYNAHSTAADALWAVREREREREREKERERERGRAIEERDGMGGRPPEMGSTPLDVETRNGL